MSFKKFPDFEVNTPHKLLFSIAIYVALSLNLCKLHLTALSALSKVIFEHPGPAVHATTGCKGPFPLGLSNTQKSRLKVAAYPVSVSTISLRPTESRLHTDELTQLPTIIYAILRYL